ncbi:Uncharacterised protein [Mycobacterium tuberculosis]|nr:Uncharacterised protein [Mycobacterium tuberculosis]COV20999.1 Uncharacterised protein [Mycobacterium tuberculosis]
MRHTSVNDSPISSAAPIAAHVELPIAATSASPASTASTASSSLRPVSPCLPMSVSKRITCRSDSAMPARRR